MSAGLPGIGLGGLFFIISALLAPLVELARTVRGTSSAAAWAGVGRNFALAVAMIAAIELTLRLAEVVIAGAAEGPGVAQAENEGGAIALPPLPVVLTATLLAAVLCGAKLMQLAAAARRRTADG
jgi:hypothetical protein